MGLFSRRRAAATTSADATGQDAAVDPGEISKSAGELGDADEPSQSKTPLKTPQQGPFDASHAPSFPGGRVDLGALQIPAIDGLQLRLDVEQGAGEYGAVILALGGSTLELRAFAAPRTDGIWDELRQDISDELTRTGARVTVAPGPYGKELLAHIPVTAPDGTKATVAARFLGVDGPRWLLRGVLQGQAAVDEEAATRLRDLLANIVVVRGGQARPPRELLPLHAPGAAVMPEAEDLPGLENLDPGPTIAEVR